MPAPVRLPAGLLACAALALGGCGQSEEDKVRGAVADFGEATAKKDYQRLCDELLSRELVARVRQTVPCEVALTVGFRGVQQPKLTVRSVKVEGDRAQAQVRSVAVGQPPSDDTLELVRQGERWRIASLAGEAGPIPGP